MILLITNAAQTMHELLTTHESIIKAFLKRNIKISKGWIYFTPRPSRNVLSGLAWQPSIPRRLINALPLPAAPSPSYAPIRSLISPSSRNAQWEACLGILGSLRVRINLSLKGEKVQRNYLMFTAYKDMIWKCKLFQRLTYDFSEQIWHNSQVHKFVI